MHDIVLLEQVSKHSRCTQRVDVGGDEDDYGGRKEGLGSYYGKC
jgi:hypothetical protein